MGLLPGMHDFYLAKQILDQVLLISKANCFKNIKTITIKLGNFIEHQEEILPENIKNNFQLLAKNTIAKSAKLNIQKFNKPNYWELAEIDGE